MNKKLMFVLVGIAIILAAPAIVLAAPGDTPNGEKCISNGAEHRPEGKGPDCPESESQSSEQQSSSTTQSPSGGQSTQTADNPNANAGEGGPPANGTRGNADNKDPGGQDPPPGNASSLAAAHAMDHNKGYECDDNPGIGDGNPAHSTDCVRVESTQAAPPTVLAAPPAAPAAVLPASLSSLPRTGARSLPIAILAVQLILAGVAVVMIADRFSKFTIEIDW